MFVLAGSIGNTRRLIVGLGQSGLLLGPVRRGFVEPGARMRGELRPLLICHYGRLLWQRGMIAGCCGNLSTRSHDRSAIYITPRSANKSRLHVRDIPKVALDADDNARKRVSVEFPLHCASYQADDEVGAVIHTHAPALTALSMRDLELADILPEAAQAVGNITRVPHHPAGSQALADGVAEAVTAGATLILLEHHGVVAVGRDLPEAYDRMELGEISARTALLAETSR
jgi:L-fuculose-phosphate aldolase